jgi:predicted transglutaminase-like cysteine proteinase
MYKRLLGPAALLAGLCMGAADASASDVQRQHQPLIIKGSTKTPIGARQFCAARPDDCAPADTATGPVVLTEALRNDLIEVNQTLNREVVAVTDAEFYQQREFWTYPDGFGDCEDFALAKRRELLERGWPASSLLMAMVRQRNGEAHAVLIAVTDMGDLVLDNLVADVVGWDETSYKFIKMQTPASMNDWVDIEDDRVLWVASN